MDDENKRENKTKIPILWMIFRKDAEEMSLPARVIEGIKIRLKEKLSEK